MDDAIRMSDALDIVYNTDVSDCKNAEDAVGKIYQAIGDLPNLDVVPVVRCKDCKWRFSSNCPMFHEELTYNEDDGYEWIDRDHTSDDGFCEQGARMDGEENAAD